jgi:hypothetical protein
MCRCIIVSRELIRFSSSALLGPEDIGAGPSVRSCADPESPGLKYVHLEEHPRRSQVSQGTPFLEQRIFLLRQGSQLMGCRIFTGLRIAIVFEVWIGSGGRFVLELVWCFGGVHLRHEMPCTLGFGHPPVRLSPFPGCVAKSLPQTFFLSHSGDGGEDAGFPPRPGRYL